MPDRNDEYTVENSGRVFSSAMFGFNKEEVLEYLEQVADEHARYQQEAENRIQALNQRIEALETGGGGNLFADDDTATLQQQLQTLERELEIAREAAQQAEEDLHEYKKHLLEAQQENDWLREQYQNDQHQIAGLTQQAQASPASDSYNYIAELQEQLQQADDTIAQLQEQLQNSAPPASPWQQQPAYGTNTAQLQNQLQQADDAILQLQDQLQGDEDTIAQLQWQLQNNDDTMAQLQGQLQHSTDNASKLEEQLQIADNDIIELRTQLDNALAQLATFQNTPTAAAQQTASSLLAEAHTEAQRIVDTATAERDRLRRQLRNSTSGLAENVANLRAEIGAVESGVSQSLESVQFTLVDILSTLAHTEQDLNTYALQAERFPTITPMLPKQQAGYPGPPAAPPQEMSAPSVRSFRPTFSTAANGWPQTAAVYQNEDENNRDDRLRNLSESLVDTLRQMMEQ